MLTHMNMGKICTAKAFYCLFIERFSLPARSMCANFGMSGQAQRRDNDVLLVSAPHTLNRPSCDIKGAAPMKQSDLGGHLILRYM